MQNHSESHSYQLLSAFLHQNPLAGLIVDPEDSFRILEANQKAAALYGYSKEELQNKRFPELCKKPESFQALEMMALGKQAPALIYARHIFADSSIHNVEVIPSLVGDKLLLQIHKFEETEIKSQLIESKEHSLNLINTMVSGFALHEIIIDENGQPCDYRFLNVNPAFEAMTEKTDCEIIGKTVLEVWPQTEPYWIQKYGQVAMSGVPIQFENYSQALDKYFSVHAYSPKLGQFAVQFIDISEQKKRERELKEQRDLFTDLADHIDKIFWIRNTRGEITYITPSYERIFKQSIESLYADQSSIFNQLHPDDKKHTLENVQNLIENYTAYDFENRIILKNGDVRVLHSRAYPVYDEEDQIKQFVGVVQDITMQKEYESQLRQYTKERENDLATLYQAANIANQQSGIHTAIQQLLGTVSKAVKAAACICSVKNDDSLLETDLIVHPQEAHEKVKQAAEITQFLAAIKDLQKQKILSGADFPETNLKANDKILVTPLAKYGHLISVFNANHELTTGHTTLILAVADQLSLVLDNINLQQQIRNSAAIEERQRIARELHDSVTQSLYSLNLVSRAGLDRLEDQAWDDVEECLVEIQSNAVQSLKEMRLLLYELHPPILEDAGLVKAIQNRLDSVERKSNLQVIFEHQGDLQLKTKTQAELYRVIIETLNNALKHAKASQLKVQIQNHSNHLEIAIIDNGVGFDPQDANLSGFGLNAMRARVHEINGQLTVESMPQNGTRIHILCPLEGENHD